MARVESWRRMRACWVVFAVAGGLEARADPGREALEGFARGWSGVEGASVEWRGSWRVKESPDGPEVVRTRIARFWVDRAGRFACHDLETADPGAGPAGEVLKHFVYFDGRRIHESKGAVSRATQFIEVAVAGEPRWFPPQWSYAPWPLVSGWARELLGASDVRVEAAEGGWRASASSLPHEIRFSDDGRLLEFVTRSGGAVSTMAYEECRAEGSWNLPTVLRKRFTHRRGSLPEERWTLRALSLNPADLEERLRFDAGGLDCGRFDPATGDVFAPDGTFRYNEKEVLAALDERTKGASRWRTALYVLAPTAVVLSALVAYRRLRGGGA